MDRSLDLQDYTHSGQNFDVERTINFVFGFLVDLPTLWPKTTYWQKTKLMGLIFPKKPIYNYQTFTTPKLSHIFQAKTAYAGGENALVNFLSEAHTYYIQNS